MAGIRSNNKKSTAQQRRNSSVSNENMDPISSPTKMTKEQKAQARERARAAMLNGTSSPVVKTKKTPTKTTKPKVAVKEEVETSVSRGTKTPVAVEETEKNKDVAESAKEDKKVAFKEEEEEAKKEDGKKEKAAFSISAQTKPPTKPIKKYVGVPNMLLVDMQSSNAGEVQKGMWNLHTSMSNKKNDPFQKNAKDADLIGAAGILILTLGKWEGNYGIQATACQCIRVYGEVSQHGRAALLKAGAIEALVVAMEEFPSSESLQIEACRALLSLSSHPSLGISSNEFRQTWNSFVFDIEGIRLIVSALNVLEKTPDSIADCASLLNNLLLMSEHSNYDEVKTEIRKFEAQSNVFLAMQKHCTNSRLRKEGGALTSKFF